MTLLFFLRKLSLAVLYPPVLLCLAALAGLLLAAKGRYRRQGQALAALSLLLLLFLSLPVVADFFVRPLENTFPVVAPAAVEPTPAAIVILGSGSWDGAPDNPAASLRSTAAARMGGGIALARAHPDLPVLVGGQRSAAAMAAYGELVGNLGRDRFVLLDTARTTGEEAGAALEAIGPGRIILVTSALHLPRAVRTFGEAGFEVLPHPVDFRQGSPGFTPAEIIPSAASWDKVQAAAHEYLGLLAGWLF